MARYIGYDSFEERDIIIIVGSDNILMEIDNHLYPCGEKLSTLTKLYNLTKLGD